MIAKRGAKQLQGRLFEFLRNDKVNANDFFANKAGRARTPSRVNQFGGTVGGPIVKDKLFYFFNYEGYRERTSSLETITSPTAAQRTGDFSGLRTAAGQLIQIFDPTTTVPDPATAGNFIRTPFPNNVIPASRINPIATNILKYYPQPNLAGQSANAFLTSPTPIGKDYYSGRIDYNLSPTRRLAGRFTKDDLTWQFANFFNNIADVDGRAILIPRDSAYLSYTESIRPTLLFDGRIGFNHQTETYNTPSQGFDITQLGMPPTLSTQSKPPPGATQGSFPALSWANAFTCEGTTDRAIT